jgi:magnesium-transporting ATPase (P-type)
MSIILLALFLFAGFQDGFGAARTVLFTSAVLFEFAIIISIKRSDSLGEAREWLSNKFLIASVAGSTIVQFALLQFPITQKYFDLAPIGTYEYALILGGTVLMYIASGAILKFAGWEKENGNSR